MSPSRRRARATPRRERLTHRTPPDSLSLLLEEGHHGGKHAGYWTAGLRIADIMRAMITFLDEPNPGSVANPTACNLYTASQADYEREVRRTAAAYPALLAKRIEAESRKGGAAAR